MNQEMAFKAQSHKVFNGMIKYCSIKRQFVIAHWHNYLLLWCISSVKKISYGTLKALTINNKDFVSGILTPFSQLDICCFCVVSPSFPAKASCVSPCDSLIILIDSGLNVFMLDYYHSNNHLSSKK